jgi:hypothetical protein
MNTRHLVLAVAMAACASDPREPYEDALNGSHWQMTFGAGQPLLGCTTPTACLHPAPKLAMLPSGDATGLEPGCTGMFQITVADRAHPFAEQTSFEQSCSDASTLACIAHDSMDELDCQWDLNDGFDLCGGCWFGATLVRLD